VAETAGAELLRRRNIATVLRSLRADGPASRAELSGRTGLAKATVGTIVGGLERLGAVAEEARVHKGDRGRPGTRVTLAGGRPVGVGLEVNVEYVAAVAVDLVGAVRHRATRMIPHTASAEEALGEVADDVATTLASEGLVPVGATVAVPGLIAADDRTIAWTPNLGITGTSLGERIDSAFGWHDVVRLSNDADCAALAEQQHGAGRGSEHLLYLTGTVGIGAGLIEDGRLVRGGHGFAGEVGHLPLGDPTARCGCGRSGCWEASIGLNAMLRAIGAPEAETPHLTAVALARRAAAEPAVQDAVAEIGSCLGRGLAILTGVLDPAVIVLGGYFAPLGGFILGPARAELEAAVGVPVGGRPVLRVGLLGTESAALGAAERALGNLLEGSITLS